MNYVKLKQHDIFTIDIMYLLDITNLAQFKILRVYKKKFYPSNKIEWLKFWEWHKYLKEHILIDVEFLGDGNDGKLYKYK